MKRERKKKSPPPTTHLPLSGPFSLSTPTSVGGVSMSVWGCLSLGTEGGIALHDRVQDLTGED
jgi:hypothetical protein